MKIFIKNMVCQRCIMAVESELEKLKLKAGSIALGEVEFEHEINSDTIAKLDKNLNLLGFEILNDKKSQVIIKVKNLIIDLVHSKNNDLQVNLSDYIIQNIPQDYNSISNLFSQTEGITIEQYYILQKIERVKELLVYDELSLSEISFLLRYSSASHLSRQFSKVTGQTVTEFKKSRAKQRQPLDSL